MKRVLLIVLALLIYALITAPVGAGELQGVKATVWDVTGQNNAPALTEGQEPVCTVTLTDISHNFDMEPLCGMYEDFIVHFEGWITYPQAGTIRLQAQADDGTRVYLDGTLLIDDWVDKGGGGLVSESYTVTAGQSQHIDVWYYENGGGAWIQMWTSLDDTWTVVSPDVLTQQQPVPLEPSPTPTPIEPTPIPSPTPSPEATPLETQTPKPSSTPTETASKTPTPTPEPTKSVEPVRDNRPTPLPTLYMPTPTPAPSLTPVGVLNSPQVIEPAPTPSAAAQARGFHLPIIKIPDITKIGNDMTPEQRKQSQQVVVGSIIVAQIARRVRR